MYTGSEGHLQCTPAVRDTTCTPEARRTPHVHREARRDTYRAHAAGGTPTVHMQQEEHPRYTGRLGGTPRYTGRLGGSSELLNTARRVLRTVKYR